MRTSDSIAKIAPALVKAQSAMQAALKDATNPHFKSKYADLGAVIDAVKGPLIANGILFMQSPSNDSTGVQVTTRLQHESGEFIEDTIYLPVPTQTPQAYGSGITYAKRYALQSMCGVPSEDDDGQAASAPKTPVSAPIPANAEGIELWNAASDEFKDYLSSRAKKIIKLFTDGGDVYGYVKRENFDSDTKLMLWTQLPANVRAAIKKANDEMRAAA
jgi:hypothetical protein